MIIEISNFMCHNQLEIKIEDVIIITGPNGAGKSAIFHALNWLIEGGTNNFVTDGEKDSYVKLSSENAEIERGCKGSSYYIKINNKVVATTKSPLQEVIDKPISLDFYSQFDAMYLLSSKPTERLEILNKLFDIEVIEEGLASIKKDLLSNKKQIESEEKIIEELNNKVSRLSGLDINFSDKEKLPEIYEKLSKLREYNKTNKIIVPGKASLKLQTLTKLNTLNKIKGKISISIPGKITNNIPYLEKVNDQLKKIKKVEDTIVPDKIKFDKYNFIKNNKTIDRLNKLKTVQVALSNIDITKVQNRKHMISKQLKGEACPVCKRKL